MTDRPTICDDVEPLLPLLGSDDLTAGERAQALAHLEGCEPCRATRACFESTAAALEASPLRHPDAARLGGLKERVLAAAGVSAACPRELDVVAALSDFARPTGLDLDLDLDAAGRDELDRHVAGCASCADARRAFGQVGVALDRAPLVAADAARMAGLKAAVLARVAPARAAMAKAAPAPSGRLLRWPLLRIAAAALVAFGLGLGTPRPGPSLGRDEVLALRAGADRVLATRGLADESVVALARHGYAAVIERSAAGDDELASTVAGARRELAALDALERAAREANQGDDALHRFEELLAQHLTADATFKAAVLTVACSSVAPTIMVQPSPLATPEPRHDLADMEDIHHLRGFVKDGSRLHRAIDVRLGIDAEQRGEWIEAKGHYDRALAGDEAFASSPLGVLASEGLARLK